MRKILAFVFAPVLALIALTQWREVRRYLKIKQMSKGHPENVPAGGATAYPRSEDKAVPDGTGDFDAAMRGGPKASAHPEPSERRG